MSLSLISQSWKKFVTSRCRSAGSASCVFCSGPGSVVLDFDRILAHYRLPGVGPDCLVFEKDGTLHVGVVELKGRRYRLEHAIAQLEAGQALATKILSDLGVKNYKIYLIIVAPSHPGSALKARRARQRSTPAKRSAIITARCGDTFSKARRPRLAR